MIKSKCTMGRESKMVKTKATKRESVKMRRGRKGTGEVMTPCGKTRRQLNIVGQRHAAKRERMEEKIIIMVDLGVLIKLCVYCWNHPLV